MPDRDRLQWTALAEDDFTRFVDALLLRKYAGTPFEAFAPDGRGGDDGIDVGVRPRVGGEVVHVYQVKFFRDGFSGDRRSSRRRQIKKSFQTAVQHAPQLQDWSLVLPTKVTPGERRFVEALEVGDGPRVHIFDSVLLDDLLAMNPDLHDFAVRDALLDQLRAVGLEQRGLAGPNDLVGAAQHLYQTADARSIWWRSNYTVRDGVVTEEIVAKHPDAPKHEPIKTRFRTDFTDRETLQAEWVDGLKYGLTGPLILPEGVVRDFQMEGPPQYTRSHDGGVLEIHPVEEGQRRLMEVSALSSDGAIVSSLPLQATPPSGGTHGVRVLAEYGDAFKLIFTFRNDAPTGTLTMSASFFDVSASLSQRVLQFIQALERTRTVGVTMDGKTFNGTSLDPDAVFPDPLPNEVADLIADLARIESLLGVTLTVPTEIANLDRVTMRFVRMLLEGKVAMHPNYPGFTMTMTGADNQEARQVLTGGGTLGVIHDRFAVQFNGTQFDVGAVTVFTPRPRAIDPGPHLAALDDGTAAGRTVQVRAAPNSGFAAFIATRVPDQQALILPEPYLLPDGYEHPHLLDVQQQVREDASAVPPPGPQT